jgi:hypothetical protein
MAIYEVSWQKVKLYKPTKRKEHTNGVMKVEADGVFAAKNAAKFRLGHPVDSPDIKITYNIIGARKISQ